MLMKPDRMDQSMLHVTSAQIIRSNARQGLLAVPFVLHSHPTAVYDESSKKLRAVAADTHQRYREIMRDVENLILDHSTAYSISHSPTLTLAD